MNQLFRLKCPAAQRLHCCKHTKELFSFTKRTKNHGSNSDWQYVVLYCEIHTVIPKNKYKKQKKSRIWATLCPLVRVRFRKPILYHASKSTPWVLSIPWVHVYTMRLCQYHEALSIPWVHVYTMSLSLYHESRSSNYRNTKKNITVKRKTQ